MYSDYGGYLHPLCGFVILICTIGRLDAQITPVPVCESTGHRCITLDQCTTLANGQYQWCGGCQYNVRCQGGVGELFTFYNEVYTQWDDNRKNYEFTSTTCVECYYPCPPGPSAPPQPVCERTGLGCLVNSCSPGSSGNFQFCGDCSHYAQCIFGVFSIATCPDGTVYDDFARICQATSTTCRECYEPCAEPTTLAPTTVVTTTLPTTVEITTVQTTTTTTATTTAARTTAEATTTTTVEIKPTEIEITDSHAESTPDRDANTDDMTESEELTSSSSSLESSTMSSEATEVAHNVCLTLFLICSTINVML